MKCNANSPNVWILLALKIGLRSSSTSMNFLFFGSCKLRSFISFHISLTTDDLNNWVTHLICLTRATKSSWREGEREREKKRERYLGIWLYPNTSAKSGLNQTGFKYPPEVSFLKCLIKFICKKHWNIKIYYHKLFSDFYQYFKTYLAWGMDPQGGGRYINEFRAVVLNISATNLYAPYLY